MTIQQSDIASLAARHPHDSMKYVVDQADGGALVAIVPIHDDDTGKEMGLTIMGINTGTGKVTEEVQAIQTYMVTLSRALIMVMGGHFDRETAESVKNVVIKSHEFLSEVADAATEDNKHIKNLSR